MPIKYIPKQISNEITLQSHGVWMIKGVKVKAYTLQSALKRYVLTVQKLKNKYESKNI